MGKIHSLLRTASDRATQTIIVIQPRKCDSQVRKETRWKAGDGCAEAEETEGLLRRLRRAIERTHESRPSFLSVLLTSCTPGSRDTQAFTAFILVYVIACIVTYIAYQTLYSLRQVGTHVDTRRNRASTDRHRKKDNGNEKKNFD